MSQLVAHPGIVTFSLAFDMVSLAAFVGGLATGRRTLKRLRSPRLLVLLALLLFGVGLQVKGLKMPPAYVFQDWVAPLVGLACTSFLLGDTLGLLMRRVPDEPPLWR